LIPIPWLHEELVPTVDPEDVKAAWNWVMLMEFFQQRGGDLQAVHFRVKLLRYIFSELGLPEVDNGKPSDAIVKAVARMPVKVTPNLEYDGLPCDLDELLRLIEKEKGPKA
jgi:hypothetical protein